MSINRKIMVAALIGVTLGVSSCKKYLNVNTNPNAVAVPTVQTLLPAAQLYVGTAQGVDLEIDGSFFAEYWTQAPGATQYQALNKYSPNQDQFSYAWANLYSAAENFYQLYNLADSQKKTQYMAISLLMRAYTFQLITDAFGDAPFSQALKGQYADGHIVNPKYDPQDSIYKGIIAMIDTANTLINPSAAVLPGSDDLIYGGDMTKWQKFSNTLALRVYMRLSQIDPVTAQAGIAALYANAATSTFLGTGDDAFIGYGYNAGNENPLYADGVGLNYTENFIACNTCLDTMRAEADPRIGIFYELSSLYGVDTGLVCGLFVGVPYQGYSYPSQYVAGDVQNTASGNAPENLLTSNESLFLQAEAAARGWSGATAGMDDSLFKQAIAANFNYYNSAFNDVTGNSGASAFATYWSSGAYWTRYPATGSVAQKVQFIITQKYFSMCGNQGFEAWTEWRRTGYPNWFTYSKSTAIMPAMYSRKDSYTLLQKVLLTRHIPALLLLLLKYGGMQLVPEIINSSNH